MFGIVPWFTISFKFKNPMCQVSIGHENYYTNNINNFKLYPFFFILSIFFFRFHRFSHFRIHCLWPYAYMHAYSLQSCLTLCDYPKDFSPARLLSPWNSPGRKTEMGWDALFQGIFLIQGLNQHLLHCRWILYCWATGEAFQLSSVAQSSLTFCTLMDCGMPGFPVHHQHPELTQLMSIELVMPSNYLIFCCPLLPPSIFPSIRVFSNESVLHIRWPKYSNFSFSISPSNECSGLISFRMDWLDLLAVQGTLKSLLQHHSAKALILWCSAFFIFQISHPYMTTEKNYSFD